MGEETFVQRASVTAVDDAEHSVASQQGKELLRSLAQGLEKGCDVPAYRFHRRGREVMASMC